MTTRATLPRWRLRALAAALVIPALAATGCARGTTGSSSSSVASAGAGRTRADPQTAAACRARADEVYARQNRADLSRRDERDTPFSASRNSGITSAGLGDLYARDRMVASCIATSGAGSSDASTGSAFGGPNNVGGAGSGALSPSAP